MDNAWNYIRLQYTNLFQLPASRKCPNLWKASITGAVLLLFTVVVVIILVETNSSHHGGSSSSRLSSGQIFNADIHGGISEYTGGHGNDYWQYCGFKANRSITVVNLGVCGPPEGASYRVQLKLVEEYELSDLNNNPTALGETEALTYAEGGHKSVYYVGFKPPVRIKANTWYRAYVHISKGPPNTYYGRQGRDSEVVSCGNGCAPVKFWFTFNDGQPYSIGFQV